MAFVDSQPAPNAHLPAAALPRPAPVPFAHFVIGDRYHVLEELGRGGMGVVYRAYDAGSRQELALKQLLMKPDGSLSQQATALFRREFYALAQLAHPRVIAVYDYGLDSEGPYYTMELLDGGDLKELSPLPPERACALFVDVCSSLALLHARRLVHRDITPRNIRCTRDGHAKLIDFGAMVPMGPCTHTVGTPAFIAPEVVNHSVLDARTDLYSLGATLYYVLTGQSPFAARHLSELRELWSGELVLPSQLVAGIPPALDALCASLLRIDPAQRPATAFDVMQRLQAIGSITLEESPAVQEAYLTAPALIAREEPLRLFRQAMRRALHAEGSALRFESGRGLGRSRVLDACVLEAKALGATVLRVAAGTGAGTPFSLAQSLLEQLLQFLPELAPAAARAAGVDQQLLVTHSGAVSVRALDDPQLARADVQQAIAAWITAVCESHALLLAVDDLEHADEASVAMLAALALEAKELRLCLTVTAEAAPSERLPSAFKVLAQHSTSCPLGPLSRDEVEVLLTSVFGGGTRMPRLAERLFQVALGNPRDTMELARHLVHTQVIRYENGQWTLPTELRPEDLPASAAEALVARLRSLPPLARRLAEAQALAGHVMQRQDYAQLAPEVDDATLEAAIAALIEQEIVHSDGVHYRLSQRGLSDVLCGLLDPATKRERHLALFELSQRQPNVHPYFVVHHLLEAEQYERALDLLAAPDGIDESGEYEALQRADHVQLATTLQRMLELAIRLGRPLRQQHMLRRRICGVIVPADDDGIHARVMPAWLERLEFDSGLSDFRALDPALPAGERLQHALNSATARFASASERDRVYRVDEAIQELVRYVALSIVRASRTLDIPLAATLPGLLEPFTPLSPVLLALWKNASAFRANYDGRVRWARRAWGEVYGLLESGQTSAVTWLIGVRDAVAQGIARYEAIIGNKAKTLEWAAKLDDRPLARVGAMYERRLACLMQGDTDAAEHFGRQAELLALRNSPRQMFNPLWFAEQSARFALCDLAGLKTVIDAIKPLAERHPGWRPVLRAAEGQFELLRGDLTAACEAFARALTLASPDRPNQPVWVGAWTDATAGLIAVHSERGELNQAIAIGEGALEVCVARGFELNVIPIIQQLALAEAKQARFALAEARMDALIETQKEIGMQGLPMAQSYVVRARIAIWARHAEDAARFAAMAASEPGGDKLLATVVRAEPLLSEARRAGVDIVLPPSAFEASVLGTTQVVPPSPQAIQLRAALEECQDGASRTARALMQLCELADGKHAQLYLVGSDGQLTLAAASPGASPDAKALTFARDFFAQQIDDDSFTAGLTQATQMLSLPGAASYIDERGRESRLFVLTCKDRGALVYVGLAVMHVNNRARLDVHLAAHITLVASCLLRLGDTPGLRAAELPSHTAAG